MEEEETPNRGPVSSIPPSANESSSKKTLAFPLLLPCRWDLGIDTGTYSFSLVDFEAEAPDGGGCGGELFDRIVARGHYIERAAASVVRTVMEVVKMCHGNGNGVIHQDLKPENFLFSNKKVHSTLKAIDFGLSVFFNSGERFSEIVGSPYYMAPEVLKRNYGPEDMLELLGELLLQLDQV